MLEKIKNYHTTQAFKVISDVRNIGLIAFGVIALLVTWSGARVVQSNYLLQKQIAAMQQANEVARLENENLKLYADAVVSTRLKLGQLVGTYKPPSLARPARVTSRKPSSGAAPRVL